MPLDKVLIKHLDEQDELEQKLDDDIEALLKEINIRELMSSPEDVLLSIVAVLQERLKSDYYEQAARNGLQLAKNIEADGDIKIQKTKDPELNA